MNWTEQPILSALEATAKAIERQLDPLLPMVEGPEARLIEAMRYALFSGGKKLRPFLVLASADLFGVDRQRALQVGAAIECVHCYSIIHDDLPAMDDDDMRRGKPTVHVAFDEATAILAGDALQALAFDILASESTHADPNVRCKLTKNLALAAGHHGMVAGQTIDLAAESQQLDEAMIYRLQQLKTGALIRFSAESGAILAGADQEYRQALQGYAHDLGLVFQIADDLLDVEGDAATMGKAARKDVQAGKATLVSLMGAERARQQAEMLAGQAIEHLKVFDERASLLRAAAHFAVSRKS